MFFNASDRTSGTALDGTYQTNLSVPRHTAQGTWTADYFYMRDQVGNTRSLRTADLSAAGFPTSFTQTATGDTTPPTLTSFSFSPTTVDTSASAQTISITVHLSDDVAGVQYGEFSFAGPSNQYLNVFFNASDRTSGTALDGTYQTNLSVPRHTAQGTWTADYFYMRDQVGNTRSLRTADLWAAGFPTSFTQTATGDTTPPTLTSFSFSPTTVDTSASAQTISITVHLSDDVAGVQYGEFSFAGPSNQYLNVFFNASDRTSGTALDSTYQTNLSVPRHTAQGTWTADYFYMRDQVGNTRSLRTADLSAAGFPTSMMVGTSGDGGGRGGGGAPLSSDLSVTKSASAPAEVGSPLTYTITVRNAGPDEATGVKMTDSLPAGVTFVSATSGAGTCSQASGTVTCDLGTLSLNGSVTITVVVTPNAAGAITNTAHVIASTSDPISTNNTAAVTSSMGVSQHERSVTLKLKGSLRASGDVNVSDGFAACASSVPVKLQRKVSGSWKTVKSVTTSATGSYRAELSDRSGMYRALLPKTAMPSGDTCAKAISQQRLAT